MWLLHNSPSHPQTVTYTIGIVDLHVVVPKVLSLTHSWHLSDPSIYNKTYFWPFLFVV